MRPALFLAAFTLLDCGPASTKTSRAVVMRNEYAESIFSLDVTQRAEPDAGIEAKTFRPLGMERISAGGRVKRDSALSEIDDRATLDFHLAATSLGNTYEFTGSALVGDASYGDALTFTYDYDLALAKFTVKYGWQQ